MKTKLAKTKVTLLIASGVLLIFVSGSIIVSPADFYGSNNIDLGSDVSLLNELKAPAGLLLAAGVFMIIAAFRRTRVNLALSLATLIFLSYAISRAVSMAIDGVPASGLVMATGLEAGIGLTTLLVWLSSRNQVRKVAND